jgi:translation initiation factor 2B subunit (eIF-2B alpha/beta/delta family)
MAASLKPAVRKLRALSRDHRAGAAELADRAAAILLDFLRREPSAAARPLAALAEATFAAQPSMAPLLNLGERVARAAAGKTSAPELARELLRFRRQLRGANRALARRFAARVRPGATLLTYSYSSTVRAALLAARPKLARVILSEARPLLEGRRLAAALARHRLRVLLVADAALPARVREADLVAVGADAVLPDGYVNKVGTALLAERARAARKPFYVLADTSKILSPALARHFRIEPKPPAELWPRAPRRVEVENLYFERVPLTRGVIVLTEHGPLTRRQRRKSLA